MSDVSKYSAQAWGRLGRALKARRVARRMTQGQLADAAGVGVNTIANIESETKARREIGLAAICEALGWTPESYLLILEGDAPLEAEPEPEDDSLRFERPDGPTDEEWQTITAKMQADFEFYMKYRRRE